MKKVFLIIVVFISFIFNVKADIELNSTNAILYNLNDDEIIYEKNINEVKPIASLTKIMTAIVVIDNVNIKDEVLVMSEAFTNLNGYAKAGFQIGDIVTYEDLLYGLMLPSGADAANILAISVAGSIDGFVYLMNNKVNELGLINTHFSNPIGIDDEKNYSTVYDISVILKYALKNDNFKKIFSTNEYVTSNGLQFHKTLEKYALNNNLDVSMITGSKTGYTTDAGYCLSSTATLKNVDYLLVTLNADDYASYIKDAINTYEYFSTNYSYVNVLNDNQFLVNIPIKNGKKKQLEIYSNDNIKLYLPNNIDLSKLEYEYNGIDIITKNIKINDKLGTINIKYNGDVLTTYDIYLNENIKYKHTKLVILVIIILIILYYKHKKKMRKKLLRKKKCYN